MLSPFGKLKPTRGTTGRAGVEDASVTGSACSGGSPNGDGIFELPALVFSSNKAATCGAGIHDGLLPHVFFPYLVLCRLREPFHCLQGTSLFSGISLSLTNQ